MLEGGHRWFLGDWSGYLGSNGENSGDLVGVLSTPAFFVLAGLPQFQRYSTGEETQVTYTSLLREVTKLTCTPAKRPWHHFLKEAHQRSFYFFKGPPVFWISYSHGYKKTSSWGHEYFFFVLQEQYRVGHFHQCFCLCLFLSRNRVQITCSCYALV